MSLQSNLAFFGTDEFSAYALTALIKNGYKVSLVVTKPDAPVGRKRVLTPPIVKTLAQKHNIPVLQPTKVSEVEPELKKLEIVAAIVVAYGKIFPQNILDAVPKGFINVHASLLPKYRGASPIEAALFNGDTVTGISLMKLDAGMDTGSVYAEALYEILPEDNQLTLYDKLGRIGSDLLIRELDSILNGTLTPKHQDDTLATKVGMIKKSDGEIDWTKSAPQIANQIRAYSVWPGCRTQINGQDVIITEAKASDERNDIGSAFINECGELSIGCSNGSIEIKRLKPAGKREMTGKEFLAGHSIA